MNTPGWNFAKVWNTVAQARGDAPAQIHDGKVQTWTEFANRAGRLANILKQGRVSRQGKVALYLRNGPEFMETVFAIFKASAVPVNTNYRYGVEEIHHIWSNADVEAVVFHGAFTPLADALRYLCPKIALWIWVNDSNGPCPEWAVDYQATTATGEGLTDKDLSGDDLVIIYTGGTTGTPKGVMWRHHDLYLASNTSGDPAEADLAHVAARIQAAKDFPVGLSAAPLIHGTGFVFAATILSRGGCLVTETGRSFDPEKLLALIESAQVSDMCIVGDAFARPLVEHLDANPELRDITCLRNVSSSGMVWSADVKARLLVYAPDAILIDFLNSSEASGMGRSISSKRAANGRPQTGSRFQLGTNAFIIDDECRAMEPGDKRVGRLAVRGYIPLGYYKDPKKTAETFPVINGVRCSIPGDFARLLADGSVDLLGRGSTTINTGGEKVFAEEIEAAIKTCAGVRDALVVGLPDARFGQTIAAAVEAYDATVNAEKVIAHVRRQLAAYKAPRHVMIVQDVGRTVTGKADYPAVTRHIVEWLQAV
jgi:3-oxocholest-4-en-26-oate---CoA ligase